MAVYDGLPYALFVGIQSGLATSELTCLAGGGEEKVYMVGLNDAERFDELKDERLGKVLVIAWKGEYGSLEEVASDVRQVARRLGLEVDEDEVRIGPSWAEIFEIVERQDRRKEVVFRERVYKGRTLNV